MNHSNSSEPVLTAYRLPGARQYYKLRPADPDRYWMDFYRRVGKSLFASTHGKPVRLGNPESEYLRSGVEGQTGSRFCQVRIQI